METEERKVPETTADRVECKRCRGGSERTGTGGEKVTAALEARGDQTRVRTSTGKGFVGRLGKKHWSTAIYDEMMKSPQKLRSELEDRRMMPGAKGKNLRGTK